MSETDAGTMIRRAIGGDEDAIAWITGRAATSDDPVVVTMAALLGSDAAGLDRAKDLAVTARDRQVVAIASAQLGGATDLVDALSRDHLVDHPDSLIVAWIAAGATSDTGRDHTA